MNFEKLKFVLEKKYKVSYVDKRFWSKVEKTKSCWIWKGSKTSLGYGDFSIDDIRIASHRYVFFRKYGYLPKGLVLDYLCRNRACVNPVHLEPITAKENVLRGIGPSALNKKKTHCVRGHEFTSKNTRYNKGRRICIKCKEYHYRNNEEKIKLKVKTWKQNHQEETAIYMKNYAQKNSEKIQQYQKNYRLKNKKEVIHDVS